MRKVEWMSKQDALLRGRAGQAKGATDGQWTASQWLAKCGWEATEENLPAAQALAKLDPENLRAVVESQRLAEGKLLLKSAGVLGCGGEIQKAKESGDFRASLKATDKQFFRLMATEMREAILKKKWDTWVAERVMIALAEKDGKFFKRLGEALQQPSQRVAHDRLSVMLIDWWVSGEAWDGLGLCHFTDEALTDFCRLQLGNERLTMDQVRKVRQRLGLAKSGSNWVRRVKLVDGKLALGVRREK